jgi:hypothetical protein
MTLRQKIGVIAVIGMFLAAPALATAQSTTTTKTVKKTTVTSTTTKSRSVQRVQADLGRLEAILIAVNTHPNLSDDALKAASREARMLANRIYANTLSATAGKRANATARSNARDLRMHAREFFATAMKGDMTAARTHVSEALPFATRLMDWAMA